MPDQPADQRRRALAFNAVGPAVNAAGYWLPLSARRAVADAVLDAVAGEIAADQRRAVRIQTLLDDTRDRIRKLHRPASDWTWATFGCGHGSIHAHACTHCRTCYPCPTITALEPPKEQP
ncbi:hypothetical protein ACFV9E_06375 [Streptomyces sp. NPDC059835]|uniref:hypothetical protein n=1 Tax=Streptomyces sp. NPDC059835 TaxID=3346967 RepID=UPI003649F668